MQIFLYDLWTVYFTELAQMETNDRSAFGRSLPAGRENAARIFLRFLTIFQADSRKQRDVAYYADKLCITPKYLSQISKSVSGLPASEWITFYATFELVSLLNDQSKTLSEVADLMNFETASHFSRYTKKLLGKSPSEYRQNEISSFFERLRSGADVDMATPEYAEAIGHMTHCANICFKNNTTAPTPEHLRPLLP